METSGPFAIQNSYTDEGKNPHGSRSGLFMAANGRFEAVSH